MNIETEADSCSQGWQTLNKWFESKRWQMTDFQNRAASAYLAGRSGLIHAPTGSGKTLAAISGPLIEAMQLAVSPQRSDSPKRSDSTQWSSPPTASPAITGQSAPDNAATKQSSPANRLTKQTAVGQGKKKFLQAQHKAPPIRIIWITPLRALAQDTYQNLATVLSDLLPQWTIMLRTGDSSSAQRNSMRKKLPSLLVTTPESLSLLLSYESIHDQLKSLTTVIVDEWHELLGSKRGVLLQLSLARLRTLAQPRIWGLSATIGNLQQALEVLLADQANQGQLIHAAETKAITIETLLPRSIERFPWSGHLGLSQLPQVIDAIERAGSTLIFTNTRSQAELWYEAIIKQRMDWLTQTAIHHGSLDRNLRRKVEAGLREGLLKCVVCTSSLDLGVDFSPVEQCIQIGSPKGVARLAQRAGRSGHRPGAASKILCVPTHAFELLEVAAARSALVNQRIEDRAPPTQCLDVLVQHLTTLALGPGFRPEQVLPEVRSTHAYRELSDGAWQWALDFIHRGGQALQYYSEFKKVVIIDNVWRVSSRRIGQRHRMAIGTITSDSMMRVSFQRGGSLGTIEESFISRLQPGDAFLFNGRVLELLRVKDMTAMVKLNAKAKRIVPRWSGGKMPLSTQLADALREQFSLVLPLLELAPITPASELASALDTTSESSQAKTKRKTKTENSDIRAKRRFQPVPATDGSSEEIKKLLPLLQLQHSWSGLPTKQQLLVEQIKTKEGYHCFMYPMAGRLVHEGLAALVGYRLAQQQAMTLTMTVNDYGIEFFSRADFRLDKTLLKELLKHDNLHRDLLASINQSEFAKRQFRENARIAGLIFTGYPGAPKSLRNLQMSSGVLYEVLAQYDKDNQLIQQALAEVLQQHMDYRRLSATLTAMTAVTPCLTSPPQLTPLSFPLWAQRIREQVVSTEKWQQRINRMVNILETKADKSP